MVGGGEYSFLELTSNLQGKWNVICFVPQEADLASRLRSRGLTTEIVPMPPIRPWFVLRIIASLMEHHLTIRKYKPVLLYANGSRAALYAGIAGRIAGLPVLWHCRIVDPDPYLDPILCRLAHRIIANSEATAHRFAPAFQRKTAVIYNAVDLRWLKDESVKKPGQLENNWKIILVVSQISRMKRHDVILSAFDRVAKIRPDLHLVCVGPVDHSNPRWWSYLQDRTTQSEFTRRIHWIGEVDDPRGWYRSASVLVLASEKESFGRVLVEAMACGVPVIATETGGIPEVLRGGQDGLLVPPGNEQDLADSIARLLDDRSLRERLSKVSLERAKAFNLPALVNRISQIIEDSIAHERCLKASPS